MCLAPCFAGCTAEEYAAEVGARRRLSGYAEALPHDTRSSASENRPARIWILNAPRRCTGAWKRPRPPGAAFRRSRGRIETLDAVILQRGAEEDTIAVFVVRAGRIADPFLLRFTELASQPRSVEEILRGVLEPTLAAPPGRKPRGTAGESPAAELEDHLALLARWFYARPRQGEIFFAEAKPRAGPIAACCAPVRGCWQPERAASGEH